jgi:hypothetical protein
MLPKAKRKMQPIYRPATSSDRACANESLIKKIDHDRVALAGGP